VAVNMTGTFLCAREAARVMIASKRAGSIVNVASIMGLSGGGLYPNVSYQTTKGAVVNMTRALAVEWAPHGIRVNAVAPTYVRTPFIATLLEQPELMRRIEEMTPLRRLAEPEDVASAILYLASAASGMVTGHTLLVDGWLPCAVEAWLRQELAADSLRKCFQHSGRTVGLVNTVLDHFRGRRVMTLMLRRSWRC